MKVLHTADWHIGQFKGPVVDGVNLRSQDTVNCLNYMIKVAEEEKPDIVCVSGDVFHQEQIGPARYSDEMIVATDTITKLAGVAKAVIVMRGTPNHDGGGQFRVLSKMFANTGNVHIVTSPTVLRTPYADIACIPGFDKQEFRSRFPGLSADEENEAWTSYISSMVMGLRAECHKTSILMAHYTVPGCNMESGQTSFFTNFEPVIPREALEAAGYESFKKWTSEKAMSFSRYLVYSANSKKTAVVHCTHCKGTTIVDRTKIRLRNNEKGTCPLCGSQVTIKAKGRMPRICDERTVSFIEPREDGFLWRYFRIRRWIGDKGTDVQDHLYEIVRTFYKFAPDGTPCTNSYEWREYKQSGHIRWCPNEGFINYMDCILYPDNLPEAWKKTPMKYSALEILSKNKPTTQIYYPKAVQKYKDFPQLEWFIKMGLYNLALYLINDVYGHAFVNRDFHRTRGIYKKGKTIFEILGLTKENTRILQKLDGDIDELRLLQEAQDSGYNLKADELERFYKIFGCNTTLIRKENRKASIHKICRYIEREGTEYRVGDQGNCWQYSYMRHKERPDVREERIQNCAKDWLDYLNWCKELKYDLNNMFFYFPKNFKKVHDRTAAEYQALQDKKATEEKRREEERVKREAEVMKKLLDEMLKENAGIDNAFLIKGKELILRVPRDAQEIKNEGAALHHCVGTYVNRVAKGQTHIFFVRRVEEPDTPYFTMEYNKGRVIQCRGSHNCEMPQSVKTFVAAFEKLMKEREEKMERKCG